MKKFLSIAIVSTLLFSCTKRYSCKCATTLRQDGYYPKVTETYEEIRKNTSKKKATEICTNTAKQMRANTDLLFPDYITVSVDCKLKDN
ncbi:MAG: hypothetical protein K0R26_546 [Bacteroidota bacterium]|jgi:hypothetical protein|nr:hypothetical protein [Bacteroidota bacterium]